MERPPLGAAPYYVRIPQRNKELAEAILRQSECSTGEMSAELILIWAKEIERNCRTIISLERTRKNIKKKDVK